MIFQTIESNFAWVLLGFFDWRQFLQFPCISVKNQVLAPNLVNQAHESLVLMALRRDNASKGAASFEILKIRPFVDQPLPFFRGQFSANEKR